MTNSLDTEPKRDFYFWVASNASTGTFPNNKPQSFKNRLAQSLNLGDGWEMALCEIYYPNNYHFGATKLQEPAKFSVLYASSNLSFSRLQIEIPPQNFNSEEEIAAAVNKPLQNITIGSNHPAVLRRSEKDQKRWALESAMRHCEILLDNSSAQDLFWKLGFSQLRYWPDGYTVYIPTQGEKLPNFAHGADITSASLVLFLKTAEGITVTGGTKLDGPFDSGAKINAIPKILHGGKVALAINEGARLGGKLGTEFKGSRIKLLDQGAIDLMETLGFSTQTLSEGVTTFNKCPILAENPSLSIAQRPSLFVYCDKIEYQFVGDTMAPLLITVPVVPPKDNPVVWHAFQRLTYVAVRKGYINDMDISIMDDMGNPVAFSGGKVLIKLHFRKQKQ